MENTVEQTPAPDTVLKERKKPNITPEDRAARVERMRELANRRNQLLREKKGVKPPTETPSSPTKDEPEPVKPRKPRAVKASSPPTPAPTSMPVQESYQTTEAKPKMPKLEKQPAKRQLKVKKVVIQESSDSEDYGESATDTEGESDEVVYIAKKTPKHTAKRRDEKITKDKPMSSKPVIQSIPEPQPQIRIKFF